MFNEHFTALLVTFSLKCYDNFFMNIFATEFKTSYTTKAMAKLIKKNNVYFMSAPLFLAGPSM